MKISVISPMELDAPALARWRQLQQRNPVLASPYYAPEFTLAVAAVRPDVRVAVLEDSQGITGFLPHHNDRGRGSAVGAPLSDHHGVVCAPGTRWQWGLLLRSSGLAYWQFDHLPASQAQGLAVSYCVSPGLDLSRGFEAYLQARIDSGGRRIGQLPRKARRLAREVGPLRFEAHARDRAVLDTVLRQKSLQCRRTGVPDFLAQHWARELVERIWDSQGPCLSGRLSALYAGDTLVSAHLGMRSGAAWHWWLPVYSHAHAAHSPGSLLLLRVAEAAGRDGCHWLDLGKGDDPYKLSFADASLPLAEGWACRAALVTALQGARRTAWTWWKSSSLARPLRPLLRQWRHLGAGVQASDATLPGR